MSDVTIRRAAVGDAAAFCELMSDAEVFGNLLQMPYPSEELWRQRLADGSLPGKVDLHLVAVREGHVVGSAGLHPVSPALRRRHALMLGISVRPDAQGHGVGSTLMAALLDYADNWAQALRVELSVYCDNERAIKLYQRFGFEIEGRMRAYAMRQGAYVDSFAMARLHPRPPAWT
ncbi:GNAT family N-acetyltransferase [Pelomonas sp. SE-A7]|uniref:GNAT family N-acetyltransferase n=1 Tax=Pelomonas sp. SE-A7 TaxID=3054953 RepID=UPI00259CC6D5|nr:GNAT family N-acetyltransferase [Pelomonas sp. SE-A7]MDM4764445.1 GNAT family N-acetyltransferase [Pelomonas sp. SE-A7]